MQKSNIHKKKQPTFADCCKSLRITNTDIQAFRIATFSTLPEGSKSEGQVIFHYVSNSMI
jgi:hypothetical protein